MPDYNHFQDFQDTILGWRKRMNAENWGPPTGAPGAEPPAGQGAASPFPPIQNPGEATAPGSSVASLAPTTPQPNMLDRIATNLHSPLNQGLLHMGLSMMATPPRAEPYSDLEVLGRGGMAGMGAMEGALKEQSTEDMRKLMLLQANQKQTELADYHKGMLGKIQPIGSGGALNPATGETIAPLARPGAGGKSDEAYKPGHIQAFETGDGKTVYREYAGNGQWKDRNDLGGKTPKEVKGYDTMEEALGEAQKILKSTASEAGLVATAEMGAGNKWIPKLAPNISIRIPPNQMVPNVPGLTYNRRNNTFSWANVPEGGANQNMSDIKVAQKAKSTLTTDYARTGQVIKESQMDAKTLLGASDSFTRSNYPAPNKLITWTGEQAGSQKTQKEIGQLKIALLAFSRKYMRIVTGAARSVSELSVGAQDSAETILSKFDSWQTLKAKVQQAQQEINNTDTSYKDQFKELDKIIAGKSRIKKEDAATHEYIPGKGIVEIQ